MSFLDESVELYNQRCTFSKSQYRNGRLAIQLNCEDGILMAVLTVNIPEAELANDEILVKGWSENLPVIIECRKLSCFENTGRTVPTGYVEAEVWKVID